ncbi:MAG: hypothetical protein ACOX2A_09095 [Tepidanaerobacteraceae bacterium]
MLTVKILPSTFWAMCMYGRRRLRCKNLRTWQDHCDGTITAMAYINIGYTNKDKSSGVDDPDKPGYLKYCTESITGIVWVKGPHGHRTIRTAEFTATARRRTGDVKLTAPASDGGAAISHYEVSADDGTTWVTAALAPPTPSLA